MKDEEARKKEKFQNWSNWLIEKASDGICERGLRLQNTAL